MIGTYMHLSGSRSYIALKSEPECTEDCVFEDVKVTKDEEKITIRKWFKPVDPVIYDNQLTLDQCIELELSKNDKATVISKSERIGFALIAIKDKRLLINETLIQDRG
ncbi:hypothetical protein [Vibrio sp. R78045]|uniref:hypothetical protein n=1 Tax=Vibrio sp. R78045 TaxID=3093868 RepID=UPI0036F44665